PSPGAPSGAVPPPAPVSRREHVANLRVGLVSPEREVWSGEAKTVVAQTTEGALGILPGHAPVLGVLLDGSVVKIEPADGGEPVVAMVGSGFFSVADNVVSALAEAGELRQGYGGELIVAMFGSGFFTVADNEVSVLAEQAELGEEVDVQAAKRALEEALEAESTDATPERRARARLRAAGVEA